MLRRCKYSLLHCQLLLKLNVKVAFFKANTIVYYGQFLMLDWGLVLYIDAYYILVSMVELTYL